MFNWAFKKIVNLREKVAVDLGDSDVEKPFLDHLDDLRTMIVRMCVTLLLVTVITFFFCEELLAIIKYPLTLAGIADKIELQNFKVTGGFMTAMNVSLVAGVVLAFPLLLYFLLQFILPGLRSNEKKVIFPALGVGGGLFLTGVVFSYYLVAPRALEFFYQFSIDVGSGSKTEQVATAPASGELKQERVLANGFGILWESKNADVQNTIEASVDGKTWTKLNVANAEGKPVEPKDVRYVRISSAPLATGTAPADSAKITAPVAAVVTTVASTRPFIWELTEYVKFVCQFVLIFGACFELPVVVMALVKLDVLNYKVMKGTRSWAAIIIAVVAAIITPTQDALTLGLLAVPMYVLYEICIWLAWYMEKKDRQLYPEYYKEQDEEAKEVEVADDWDNDNYNPWSSGDDDDEEEENRKKTSSSESSASSSPTASSATEPKPAEEEKPKDVPDSGAAPTSVAESGTIVGEHGSEVPPPSTEAPPVQDAPASDVDDPSTPKNAPDDEDNSFEKRNSD